MGQGRGGTCRCGGKRGREEVDPVILEVRGGQGGGGPCHCGVKRGHGGVGPSHFVGKRGQGYLHMVPSFHSGEPDGIRDLKTSLLIL